jgi:predicted alpha/beta superfamily hydrolase
LGESFSDIPLLVEFLKSLSGKMPNISPPLLPSVVQDQVETSISPAQRDENGFLVHTVNSPYQTGPTKIRVLLPDQMHDDKRYRVVYVLPVEAKDGSRYGNGLREIKNHKLHNKFDAIFVAPTFSDLPWYADHASRKEIRQESYLVKVAIPFVEQTYPTLSKSAGRLLLGFSKSGWGAWSLLLRNPKMFSRAAAWDAPMMMTQIGKYGNRPIFGTQKNFERYQISRLLSDTASRLSDQHRLILTGRGNFHAEHQQVHQLMKKLQIPHQYRDEPKRKHHWNSGWVTEAVELLFK